MITMNKVASISPILFNDNLKVNNLGLKGNSPIFFLNIFSVIKVHI